MIDTETTFAYLIDGELTTGNIAKYADDWVQAVNNDVDISLCLWAPSDNAREHLMKYKVDVSWTHNDGNDWMHHVISVFAPNGICVLQEHAVLDGRS